MTTVDFCYDALMKRTTVSLSDDISVALEREAKRTGVSCSAVARLALEAYFGFRSSNPRPLPFAEIGRSGHRDTAARFEEVFASFEG